MYNTIKRALRYYHVYDKLSLLAHLDPTKPKPSELEPPISQCFMSSL